ncbi:hypothetical protein ANN_08718 [Periplaneta americana]|uniref:Uncharacterized protein n=1 Tax=Periplaneta americana TaxID=6978 RepID=A0ABQ8T2V1_PERAM|nr:hypothetical protein ANN_08718 [Periplaneta americana]
MNQLEALAAKPIDTSTFSFGLSHGDENFSITDLSVLIENLIKADRYGEASKIAQGMLEKNMHPLPRIFRFLLNRLANSGDVDTLTAIGNQITPEQKKMASFDNRLCHANIISGRAKEYLRKLQEEIENAKDHELENLTEKFPRGGAIGILTNHPELHEDYEQMALKYASRGITSPINVLWMHLFVQGKEDAAKKLWDEYLVHTPRVMFQYVLQEARNKQDESIPRKLLSFLHGTAVSEGAKGNAYSCLVDILEGHGSLQDNALPEQAHHLSTPGVIAEVVDLIRGNRQITVEELLSSEKYDDALLVVKEALEDVCLENMNRTALTRLQAGLLEQGKTFPFKIPPKDFLLRHYSEDQGEHFHQDIKEMERMYQWRWNEAMMADYCWMLKGDSKDGGSARKSKKRKYEN